VELERQKIEGIIGGAELSSTHELGHNSRGRGKLVIPTGVVSYPGDSKSEVFGLCRTNSCERS